MRNGRTNSSNQAGPVLSGGTMLCQDTKRASRWAKRGSFTHQRVTFLELASRNACKQLATMTQCAVRPKNLERNTEMKVESEIQLCSTLGAREKSKARVGMPK